MRPTSTSTGLRVRAAALAALLVLAGPATLASGADVPEPDLCVEEPADDDAPAADPTPPAEDSPAEPVDGATEPEDSSTEPGDDATEPEDAAAEPADGAQPEDGPADPAPVQDEPGDGAAGPECADDDDDAGDRADGDERVVVVPEPVRTDATGEPGYGLPLGEGFTWIVNGALADTLVAAGTAQLVEGPDGRRLVVTAAALGVAVEHVVVGAVAEPDRTIVVGGGAAGSVRYVVDHRTSVELEAPTAADGPGREDVLAVPDVAGQVVSDDDGEVLTPGEHAVTAEYVDGVATVALSVQAGPGYRLESGGLPVESLPGAAEPVTVTLTVTDEAPPAPEVVEQVPVPATPRTPEQIEDVPAATVEPEAPVVTAHLLTIEPHEPAPPVTEIAADLPAETAPAIADPQQLPDTGPEGLGLMVMLGGILLGGARLVMGMRGDE